MRGSRAAERLAVTDAEMAVVSAMAEMSSGAGSGMEGDEVAAHCSFSLCLLSGMAWNRSY